MRVLMISLDKTLLGADGLTNLPYSGDVLERHQKYAQYLDGLDIIVFSKNDFSQKDFDKLRIYPTNSLSKIFYVWDAYRIGQRVIKGCEGCGGRGGREGREGREGRRRQGRQGRVSLRKARPWPPRPWRPLIVTQDPFLTGLVGWLLKRKFKIPLLIHFHGDFWQNKYWLKERWHHLILLWLSKFLVKKADGIRVVSSGIKTKLIEAGLAKSKIKVIPTPVNLAKFENYNPEKVEEIRQQYGHKKIILFVGRLSKEKNLPLLLRALQRVRSQRARAQMAQRACLARPGTPFAPQPLAVFLIIGDGPERKKLECQVIRAKMQDAIKFLASIKQDDLVNYYQACQFVVLPSFSESFGKILLEAGMAGKPAVASLTTGAKEIIIDNQTGFLVPINDEKILAERILKLLQDKNLAQQMGQAAKEHIQARFNPEQIIQKMVNGWRNFSS